jgi:hypothetical protein
MASAIQTKPKITKRRYWNLPTPAVRMPCSTVMGKVDILTPLLFAALRASLQKRDVQNRAVGNKGEKNPAGAGCGPEAPRLYDADTDFAGENTHVQVEVVDNTAGPAVDAASPLY